MVVRIGIVGLGLMGTYHLRLLKRIQGVDVSALCDIDERRVAKIANEYGVEQRYTDFREMFERAGLDAVIIATPPKFHKELAVEALKSGLYVLLEKPMATNINDALEVYETTKKYKDKLMIGFSLRFNSTFMKIYDLIENGFLGAPLNQWHIALGRIPPNPWIRNREISGGMVNEHAVHVIYVFYWYAGKPIDVYSKTFTFTKDVTIEDNAIFMIRHENGALSVMDISWSSTHPWRKWGLVAENGTATVEGYLGGRVVISNRKGEKVAYEAVEEVDEMYLRELKHFIECVKKGERPLVNEEDGIIVQKIVDSIYKSSLESTPVKISI
ncbi:MAG: hypothetical protein DRJ59_02075 [Thermoprotei archaeon]|nr:MAG: hypothetical protein DRJ59_02075 [Thermoprotei archaeon]